MTRVDSLRHHCYFYTMPSAKKDTDVLREKALKHYEIARNVLIKARKIDSQRKNSRQYSTKPAGYKKITHHHHHHHHNVKTKGTQKKIPSAKSISAHTKLAHAELCEKLRNENTVNSLKVVAAANKIAGFSSMRKDELCDAIARTFRN